MIDVTETDDKLIDRFPDEEDESDLAGVAVHDFSSVAINGADWTAETLLNQLKRGNIELNPNFQRRDAWTDKRKSRFIESLILGIPVPQILLAEHPTHRKKYIVIDGKQRLLALRQFGADEDDDYNRLHLSDLEILSHLNSLSLRDLIDDDKYSEELRGFENQTIRTVIIQNWKDERRLHLIFLRINSGSVQLSAQELRQALLPGKYLDFIEQRSGESHGLQRVLGITKADFRMRDAELLVRGIAFNFLLDKYSGNLKDFLDDSCEIFNSSWSEQQANIEDMAYRIDNAIEVTYEIFGNREAFRKWSEQDYETRFNRAIFDIMLYYFIHDDVAKSSVQNKDRIVRAFTSLCDDDEDFSNSITSTTKSRKAVADRFIKWGEALNAILPLDVNVPSFDGRRMTT